MLVSGNIAEIQRFSLLSRLANKKIGFVPTMGALHQGHISLVNEAKKSCDLVVTSIFVNPTQFNNPEDLLKYPKTIEADLKLLRDAGCDAVFVPEVSEMYPVKPSMTFNFGYLDTVLEGAFRPGHFSGVALVVSKLFHIVQPDKAFFGQKDLQQVAVVKQLVQELSFPLEIITCPIMRESNGLAMSSRNMRLTESQRSVASIIYKTLLDIKDRLNTASFEELTQRAKMTLEASDGMLLEYLAFIDPDTFQIPNHYHPQKSIAIAIAVQYSGVRLIDNIIVDPIQ